MRTDLCHAEGRGLEGPETHGLEELAESEARELNGGGRLRVPVGYTATGEPIYGEE